MEVSEFVKLLKKNLGLIFLFIFLGVLIGIIYSYLRTRFYSLEFTFIFDKKGSDVSQTFKYDSFYTIETVGELSKFIKEYLSLKEIKTRLIEKYKNNLRSFEVKRPEKGLVKFKILLRDIAPVEEIVQTLRIESNLVLSNLKGEGENENYYQVVNSQPLVKKQEGRFSYHTLIFGFIGLIFSFVIILIKKALNYDDRR